MSKITEIADKSLAGEALALEEVEALYQQVYDDVWAKDAYYMRWAARKLAVQAAHGRGALYAQVGIDAGPCPDDCRFCTFAACNYKRAQPRDALDLPTVVEICRVFAAEGIEWISLMTTTAFPFDDYLQIVRAVRAAIPASTRIMSNVGDISLEQACQLKAAGVAMAYHAPRLGEGELTRVPLQTRFQTMDNICQAGLLLSTGVEPVRMGTSPRDLAKRTLEVLEYRPYCAGTVTITVASGTVMEDEPQPSMPLRRMLGCAFRLAAGGNRVPFGNFNSSWADAGARPRGQEYIVDRADLAHRVSKARQALIDGGWDV